MKKFLSSLAIFASLTAFSQNTTTPVQDSTNNQVQQAENQIYKRDRTKNEITLGALNLVAFGALDISYERLIDNNSSWAVEGFVKALNRDNEDIADAYRKDYSISGKYKYFFGERTAWGFYVNGLAMISGGDYDTSNYDYSNDVYIDQNEKYTDFALGFGLGGKFVATNGFVFDLNSSIGRNIFNANAPTIVFQLNANLGFRF